LNDLLFTVRELYMLCISE